MKFSGVYPQPEHLELTGEEWFFPRKMILNVPAQYADRGQMKLFAELYKNFTGGAGKLKINRIFTDIPAAVLSVGCRFPDTVKAAEREYSVRIGNGKAELSFSDKRSFAHAFGTLLKLLQIRSAKRGEETFTLPIGRLEDGPAIKFRGLHLCVFSESGFVRTRKFIRLAGLLGYSHIVLEFWGMFPFKTNKAFGRKNAYPLRKIRLLAEDAAAFGMEIVPMLNIYGHAAQNRSKYGKHVVLEQNPRMAPYFETNGWNWNLANPDTVILQKKLIDELLDAFGNGGYFAIGCDEACDYAADRLYAGKDETQILIDHVNAIAGYLKSKGRTTIMWADMLLSVESFPGSTANGVSAETCDRLLSGLDKSIILADWQYWTRDENLPTSRFLSEKGFRVITAPYDDRETSVICLKNAEKYGYFGFMQTTWHTVYSDFFLLPAGAVYAWSGSRKASETRFDDVMRAHIARYLRCSMRVKRYEDEGIIGREIELF